jgi:hypothetical protein
MWRQRSQRERTPMDRLAIDWPKIHVHGAKLVE